MRWSILIIVLIQIHLVYSQAYQTLNQLLNDTFNNYDKRTRPFQNERTVLFSARITVAMLINLVSEAQTVSFNMAQYLKMLDMRFDKFDNF
uniref:Neur_chan_LBD domain-containing protein n=1 Tax=Acrobeloides nanus TaxID=290746 RepID=A0A914DHR4_9BILA